MYLVISHWHFGSLDDVSRPAGLCDVSMDSGL